ncbi:ASB_collapsed_G0018220.mRNA.1.CDS.1 [Saccharomyces cerevisiae]|nr:ASB_collapsed_G0018220.mRNA.1.CDS.1 [Saccharomyces cerevisiae]
MSLDLNNISVEEQTIVLSSEPNAIVLGYFADLPSRQPPSIQNGILAVTTIGRKYILDFGPGYTRDHFFMANTPVTTQLWQSGRPT